MSRMPRQQSAGRQRNDGLRLTSVVLRLKQRRSRKTADMADISPNNTLSPAQHNAVAALLSEASVRKAAETAGVKERTLYSWLKTPAFADAYRAARREATSQAIARIQQFSAHAAGTLVQLMAPGNPAAVRLTAASKVLDLAIKSVEIDDLAARLEALERAHAEKL
jgi:hypothetical protein